MERPNSYKTFLKPDAVPSVFSKLPQHLQPKQTVRRQLKRRLSITDTSTPPTKISKEQENESLPSCSVDEPFEDEQSVDEQSLNESSVDKSSTILTRTFCTQTTQTDPSPTRLRLKKKVKVLQQKVRRQIKKVSNLKELLKELRKKMLVDEARADILSQHFDGMSKELFENQKNNKNRKATGKRYSREIKKFALTLHFFSPRAYNYYR